MKETKILGVKVNIDLTQTQALALINQYTKLNTVSLIATTNAEFVVDAQMDPTFMQILNSATLSLPDGIGVMFAHQYLTLLTGIEAKFDRKSMLFPVIAFITGLYVGVNSFFNKGNLLRLSGRELVFDMCSLAESENLSVFFLGGWEKYANGKMKPQHGDVAGRAAANLKVKYPNLNVVGATSSYSHKEEDDVATVAYIQECMHKCNVSHIDMLFVAYNHVNQEKWILRNAAKIPARVCMGIGGTLDYLSGNYRTPDPFFVQHNLEWLYKLLVQPWRFQRIFKAFPIFPLRIYFSALNQSGNKYQ